MLGGRFVERSRKGSWPGLCEADGMPCCNPFHGLVCLLFLNTGHEGNDKKEDCLSETPWATSSRLL